MSPASLFGRRGSTTTGLTWGYYGGNVTADIFVADGTVALTANATNFIEADSAGVVYVNLGTGSPPNFTGGRTPLYIVYTGPSSVISPFYTDKRTNGGTSGASSSPTTTKGDLIVRSATTDDRLPVGTNDYALTADSGETLGVKWSPLSAIVGTNADLAIFGDGHDGNLSSGFGTVALTRETYYNTVTFNATDRIETNGWPLYILHADMTNAGAGAIRFDANAGSNASLATGGAAGTVSIGQISGVGGVGVIGINGTSGNGATGNAGSQLPTTFNGGLGGAGGAGGASPTRTAGAARAQSSATAVVYPMARIEQYLFKFTLTTHTAIQSGQGGSSGAGGGGDSGSGSAGGGGGGSGAGGNVVQVYIKLLTRGASTAAGAIRARGGLGGNGGAGGTPTNTGGGGGGAGGGGGWLYAVIKTLAGASATSILQATGGVGGDGGARVGTGDSGGGGNGGDGGRITYFNISANTGADTLGAAGSAGVLGSGGTIGTGGAGGLCNVTI